GTWLRPPATAAQVADAERWLRDRAPLRSGGAAFGAVRGHNVIVVQVESLQDFAVDFTVGGQEVMPHLRRWTADSLRFTNVTDQIGWGLNDRDFLQQMVPRLEHLPRPFAAWLITLSLHHPFEAFPEAHKVLKLGALEGTPFGNYLHTMRFFDQALEDFKTALARDGLLEDSLLVVF